MSSKWFSRNSSPSMVNKKLCSPFLRDAREIIHWVSLILTFFVKNAAKVRFYFEWGHFSLYQLFAEELHVFISLFMVEHQAEILLGNIEVLEGAF